MTTKARTVKDKKYYVYAFIRKSGIPYYIGRGCNNRAWERKNRTIRSPKDRSFIKIIKNGLSLLEANELEIQLINFWGRRVKEREGVLSNMQDGGIGGSPGRIMPAAQREKMRQIHLGRKQDEEWIRRRLQWQVERGPRMEEHHKKAIKQALRTRNKVWWMHKYLGIQFYGSGSELIELFSGFFADYKPPGERKVRKGCRLCRNQLFRAWRGDIQSYKGWTRGYPPA